MGIIIQHKKHYLTRFPLWIILIIVIGFSPSIIGIVGSWLTEIYTGKPCHEGNCDWMVLSWLTLFTLPIAGIILIIYLIIVLIDSITLIKNNTHN